MTPTQDAAQNDGGPASKQQKKKAEAASSTQRQTLIRSFFVASSGRNNSNVTVQKYSIDSSTKETSGLVCKTPPTPVSPQTPETPPTAQNDLSPSTPPTDATAPDKDEPFVKRIKIDRHPKAPLSVSGSRSKNAHTANENTRAETRTLQQMYLDLGQINFAKQTVCSLCGMLYVHGVLEDAKQHSRICQDYRKGVPFQAEHARIVARDALGSIVEVRPSDSPSLRAKVRCVKQIVDHDLGFVPSDDHAQQRTAYLFIVNRRIVGMATAEIIESAYVLNNDFERSKQRRKAFVGIHQLWVHASFRKRGVAFRLVECARSKLVFGVVVPPEKVAFSSPTEAGASFARKFASDGAQVLVYDCC